MVIYLLFLISTCIFGVSKAVADITSEYDLWVKSVFSVFPKDSYFGSRDYTWVRKHKYKETNRFLHLLFTTVLVPFTDVWHLSNMLQLFSCCVAMSACSLEGESSFLYMPIVFYIGSRTVFHIFYTYIFRVSIR
jgi:hypothetical protein